MLRKLRFRLCSLQRIIGAGAANGNHCPSHCRRSGTRRRQNFFPTGILKLGAAASVASRRGRGRPQLTTEEAVPDLCHALFLSSARPQAGLTLDGTAAFSQS